jgi:dephospho-CoA kinase
MITIGLTGSIGMGKSTAAAMLRRMGLPVYDADAAVHALLAPDGAAVRPVEALFPGTRNEAGGIDRKRLGSFVFADTAALRRLEAVLHPLVRAREQRFRAALLRRGAPLTVLDIPLLYESGGDRRCDAVLVVTAPAFLQRQRVLARPGMTEEKFRDILARQMPDREKRWRTRYVIATGLGRRHTWLALRRCLRQIAGEARPTSRRVHEIRHLRRH